MDNVGRGLAPAVYSKEKYMRKYLLPQREKYFKTNLHTHTNVSDGKDSPEVVAADYKAHGYSILCLSDHNVTADHTALGDKDFLLLTGVEININQPGWKETKGYIVKTYHLNLIAKDPKNLWTPLTFSASGRETAEPYRPPGGRGEYAPCLRCGGCEQHHRKGQRKGLFGYL